MARTITASVYLGLGGSFIAQALGTSTYFKFWSMRVVNNDLSIDQRNDGLPGPPTGWSSGDSLTLFNLPTIHSAGALPEGGSSVRLNGTNQYMASVYDETASPNDIGPQSLEVIVEVHALPGVGVEPAILGGSTEFAVTLRSDGRAYGYYNGSAVVDLPITLNVPTHIVLTRADTSPDAITLYVNGVSDSATPANGTINRGYVHLGKHWTNAHYLNATYSFGGFVALAMSQAQVLAHYEASRWTDVSDDVEIQEPILIERGMKDDSPIARVSATGIASFVLDNSERNSGPGLNGQGLLGYYTPGHVNCRVGFQRGIPCKITMTAGVTEYTRFIGRVRRIAPTPDEYGDRRSYITATDWIDEAARFSLTGAAILQNVRADQVFQAVVQRMPNQPHGLRIHPGSETYTVALDNMQDEDMPALQEFVREQTSELGRTWVSREGTLVFESRFTRPLYHGDVQTNLDTMMTSLDASETTDAIVNRVIVTVHPRKRDATNETVLFSIENPIALEPGDPQTLTGTYVAVSGDGQAAERVGGLDMQAPAPGTDFAAFEFQNGTGTDNSPDLVVSAKLDASTVTFTLTNTRTTPNATSGAATIYVTHLQVRGRGLYDFQPIVLVAEDAAAIAMDGVNAVSFDMYHQENPTVGQSIAWVLLAGFQTEGLRARQITLCANEEDLPEDILARDVSDRIGLNESMTAITGEYHIQGVREEYSEGTKLDLGWWLVTPAEGDALMAWQDVPYNAANFTASGSMTWGVQSADQIEFRWVRLGPTTLAIAFVINLADVGGTASFALRLAIPGGFSFPVLAGDLDIGTFTYIDAGGARSRGQILAVSGTSYISLLKLDGSNWTLTTSDNTSVRGTTNPFEIQT